MSRIKKVILWGVGVLLVISGVGAAIGGGLGVLRGIIWILTGLTILPPARESLFEIINTAGGPDLSTVGTAGLATIVVIGFLAGGVLAPSGGNNSEPQADAGSPTPAGANSPTPSPTATSTATPTPTPTPTATPTPTPTLTPIPEPSYSVRIEYQGEWNGALSVTSSGGSSSRSISGSDSEAIEIDGDPDVVSVNAQKQDDTSRELTVQILQYGVVVAESSTTAEFGVAQVSESFF
jgi:hypothetical protein